MSEVFKAPKIRFFETMYGYTSYSEREAGRDLSEKDFRKWYNHYIKRVPEYIDVAAIYTDDDGDELDISQYWFMHEVSMWEDANNLPFN